MRNNEIINRIIPLPRYIKVSKGVSYEASRIKVEIPGEKTPPLKTASRILGRFANPGQICPDFIISLKYISRDRDKAVYKKIYRDLKPGFYEVPVCARRHLSKPLKRMQP